MVIFYFLAGYCIGSMLYGHGFQAPFRSTVGCVNYEAFSLSLHLYLHFDKKYCVNKDSASCNTYSETFSATCQFIYLPKNLIPCYQGCKIPKQMIEVCHHNVLNFEGILTKTISTSVLLEKFFYTTIASVLPCLSEYPSQLILINPFRNCNCSCHTKGQIAFLFRWVTALIQFPPSRS